MGWLLGGIIEGLVGQLCKIICKALDMLTQMFASAFGSDPTAFLTAFPVVRDMYDSFKYIGFGLIIALLMLGCVRNMVSGLGFAGEKPYRMVVRGLMAFILVATLPWFMNLIYTGVGGQEGVFEVIYNNIGYKYVRNALGTVKTPIIGSEKTDALGIGQFSVIATATNIFTNGESKVVVSLVLLVLITVIGLNFIKLLLELFERYLLINLLVLFSPMAGAAVTLESTMKIFSSYLKMFFGQMMMILMNLVSLYLVQSGLRVATGAINGVQISLPNVPAELTVFILLLLVIAMLKVLQRLDNYARDIGLTVGITGGSLVDEIIGTSKMMSPVIGAFYGKGGRSHGGGAAGAAVAAGATGGLIGRMRRGSIANMAFGKAKDFAKGSAMAMKENFALDNKSLADSMESFRDKGGFKGLGQNIKAKTHEAGLARKGTGMRGFFMGAVGAKKPGAVANIGQMMSQSTPISYDAANERATRVSFNEFASGLDYTGDGAPSVSAEGLKNVSVGTGGALGTNEAGELVAVTNYQPSIDNPEFTSHYQDAGGNDYWVQNLSQANKASREERNRGYDVYEKATKAMETGSTNYNFEGTANISDTKTTHFAKAPSAPKSGAKAPATQKAEAPNVKNTKYPNK